MAAKNKQDQVELIKLAKNTFRDIKSIKVIDFYESSPGTKNIDFDVITASGEKIELNSISDSSYRNNGLNLGKTMTIINVKFLDGSRGKV